MNSGADRVTGDRRGRPTSPTDTIVGVAGPDTAWGDERTPDGFEVVSHLAFVAARDGSVVAATWFSTP